MTTLVDMIDRAAYPLDEACRLLGGIHRTSIYKMRDRGEIRLVKLGRRTLVPADEIRRITSNTDNDSLKVSR